MGFDYGFSGTENFGKAASFAGGFLAVVLVIYLLMMAFCVAVYVFQSLSLYAIAKRRGIRNPWLAWLPVGNMWIQGSISDQYQYVVKGNIRNRRKVLMALTIAIFAVSTVLEVVSIVSAFASGNSPAAIAVTVVCGLVVAVISVIAVVLQYITLYDLYASCDPSNATVFLILSILVNVTMPFLMFISRNKDDGMPRRKTTQPAVPVVIAPAEEATATEVPAAVTEEPEEVLEEEPLAEEASQELPDEE